MAAWWPGSPYPSLLHFLPCLPGSSPCSLLPTAKAFTHLIKTPETLHRSCLGDSGSGQAVLGWENPTPPAPHTQADRLVPTGLTLRTAAPATSLPPTLMVTHFRLPHPYSSQIGPGKGHPVNVSDKQTTSGRSLGVRLRSPQDHTSGDPFQPCTCLGATLTESLSLSGPQNLIRTNTPAQPAFRAEM